jgi:hypothetical protein
MTMKALVFTLICGLMLSQGALAKDAACEEYLERQAKADKWQAQRAQIQFLESQGESYKVLSRAYRILIQDLFNCDASSRATLVARVLGNTALLSQLDMRLPATRFAEDLIYLMDRQMTHDLVLAKLRMFADLEANKLTR